MFFGCILEIMSSTYFYLKCSLYNHLEILRQFLHSFFSASLMRWKVLINYSAAPVRLSTTRWSSYCPYCQGDRRKFRTDCGSIWRIVLSTKSNDTRGAARNIFQKLFSIAASSATSIFVMMIVLPSKSLTLDELLIKLETLSL